MTLDQCLIYGIDQLLVFQHLVSLAHPGFPKIFDFLFDQPLGKAALGGAAELNHFARPFLAAAAGLARSSCWLSSQISSSAAFSV